ncbi:hypothetical protein PR048_007669 [Dryococelus australis]|uniref:Uncharacterized protein n=1 Tax=Dryococelus australis TaxID=614101 RepID=A0ABQ9HUW2_9NEOP|nr:hypothetical protein PR048_007669 [Dryococelus australis]
MDDWRGLHDRRTSLHLTFSFWATSNKVCAVFKPTTLRSSKKESEKLFGLLHLMFTVVYGKRTGVSARCV